MDGIDLSDLYGAPIPKGAPTASLQRISLQRLVENNKKEIQQMFNACKTQGVFLLNVTDHPRGTSFLREMAEATRATLHVGQKYSIEEKRTYGTRARVGIMDKGYIAEEASPEGEVQSHEVINIPYYELFCPGAEPLDLPPWLKQYSELFRSVMDTGHWVAEVILTGMETALQLPPDALTSAHRIEDPSSDFLRLVRHPGHGDREIEERVSFHAHKDLSSMGLLFAPMAGLQIADPTEDNKIFRWVEPVPGTIVVNIGEALEIVTNGLFKGVVHRVVRSPGELTCVDRPSALVVKRMKGDMPLLPLQSPLISEQNEEQKCHPVETSDGWAANKLKALTAIRAREGKSLPKELAFVYEQEGMAVPVGV